MFFSVTSMISSCLGSTKFDIPYFSFCSHNILRTFTKNKKVFDKFYSSLSVFTKSCFIRYKIWQGKLGTFVIFRKDIQLPPCVITIQTRFAFLEKRCCKLPQTELKPNHNLTATEPQLNRNYTAT